MQKSDSRWPRELLATNHMDMQMINALTPMATVVDDCPIPICTQAFPSGHLCRHKHQVAKQRFVSLLCLAQLTETVSILRNHQKVCLGDRSDISERQTLLVFVDDVRRDLLPHQLVEQGVLFSLGCLGFSLLSSDLRVEPGVIESDVLLDEGEVPLEVQRVRLSALVSFQVQADEGGIWRHRRDLIFEPIVQVGRHETPMSEHEVT